MPRSASPVATFRVALGVLPLLIALASPASATAQTPVQTGAVESPNARVFPFLGARFGVPQRLSFTTGIGFDLNPEAEPPTPSREILIALAPGLGAERASLTYVYSTGRFGGGFAGGISVLRTIRHPWQAPANSTYAGVDVAVLPLIAIGPRLGLLHRLSAPTSDHAWLWTLDFGFGF